MESRVDGGSAGDEEAEVEADALGKRKQKQIEDDLCDTYENVLRRMDAFACGDLEYEVGEKEQAEEEKERI